MPSDNLTDLRGQIERITYINEENSYTVAKVKVYGRKDLVTVIGNIVNPTPGEIISMKGEWGNHPKYGEQFNVVFCQSTTPATVYGIEKYLGSGLVKGIGPVMAKRIVKKFKEETLNIIENDIQRLADIEGIGRKRIGMIKKAWDEQREIRSIMIFLQSHGVSSGYSAKIYKQYGNESIQIVKENPYRLATDVFGIGFVTADKIAQNIGFARDSELRAEAGILHVLHEMTDEGHVYYPYESLIEKCKEILDIDREIIVKAIGTIAGDQRIVIEDLNHDIEAFRENHKAVYLAAYHVAETSLSARLKTLLHAPQAIRKIDSGKAVQWVQEKLVIVLAEKQVEAVKCVSDNKIVVITGGPGTGKTTIINAIIRIFSIIKARIMLAAPTGRAAKRMTEATGHEAKTIHRLLEYSMKKGGFQKNGDSPLDCDLLIIDETSMIDTLLIHHLLKAIPFHATFVLVGDVNQLPSVGAGNVLKDIIESKAVPVVELNEIFRQARESSIIVNAHLINEGKMPNLKSSQDKLDDFYFIEQEDPQKVMELIIHLVKERIPKRFGFNAIDDVQVLTPMHRGIIGASNLNIELQNALNPGDEGVRRFGRLYKVNDKVMQIANNYDREVYNGDIGRIISIDEEAQEVTVSMDDREIAYDYSELDELVHA
ncbi:MAG: ATP-dependent RecD-like DNA helicase, partial [Syntrophales bacterium]|nr:ATP-dependent RecD-like DNA helicase [Syntrophales bacterium]